MGSKGTRHGKVTVGGKAAARNNGIRRRPRRTATDDTLRDTPRPAPGRKDKDHCKPGRGPHTPVIVFAPMGTATCHQPDWWPEIGWMCWHEEQCGKCGRVLRRNISETECPDWPGSIVAAGV